MGYKVMDKTVGKELKEVFRQTYINGYDAGKKAALTQAQIQIQEIALRSRANRNECDYENMVVMLRDVNNILQKLLED